MEYDSSNWGSIQAFSTTQILTNSSRPTEDNSFQNRVLEILNSVLESLIAQPDSSYDRIRELASKIIPSQLNGCIGIENKQLIIKLEQKNEIKSVSFIRYVYDVLSLNIQLENTTFVNCQLNVYWVISIKNILEISHLSSLVFRNCDISSEQIKILFSELKYIRNLEISEQKIEYSQILLLGDLVGNNKIIEKLDLSCNRIGDVGLALLSPGIVKNRSLIYLDLSTNLITTQGVKYITYILENSNIASIGLNNNYLEDQGAVAIANANKKVEGLALGLMNNGIGNVGALVLAAGTGKRGFKQLFLQNNRLINSIEIVKEALINKNISMLSFYNVSIKGIDPIEVFSDCKRNHFDQPLNLRVAHNFINDRISFIAAENCRQFGIALSFSPLITYEKDWKHSQLIEDIRCADKPTVEIKNRIITITDKSERELIFCFFINKFFDIELIENGNLFQAVCHGMYEENKELFEYIIKNLKRKSLNFLGEPAHKILSATIMCTTEKRTQKVLKNEFINIYDNYIYDLVNLFKSSNRTFALRILDADQNESSLFCHNDLKLIGTFEERVNVIPIHLFRVKEKFYYLKSIKKFSVDSWVESIMSSSF